LDRVRVDHRQAGHRHGGLGRIIGLARLCLAQAPSPRRGRAIGFDDQNDGRVRLIVSVGTGLANGVAAVGDPRGPGKLELDEREDAQRELLARVG